MIDINKNSFSSTVMIKRPGDNVMKSETSFTGLKVCYIIDGNATWRINGHNYRVARGDVVLFNETQKRCLTDYGKTDFKVFIMQLERRSFTDILYFLVFSGLIKETDGVIRDGALSSVVREIYEEVMSDNTDKYEFISAKMTEFFIKAQRIFPNARPKTVVYDKISETLDIIDARAAEGISLAEAARLAGFSESAFSRRFLKCCGISFKRYVMTKKTEKAIDLLKNTDMKVVDVAFECGFSSISGFYDTFKKITGTTPDKISVVI